MIANLFIPGKPVKLVESTDLALPSPAGHAVISDKIAEYLGCERAQVDVLDSGPDYVAYTIFDCEYAANQLAFDALVAVSSHAASDDLPMVYGPVLLLTRR